MRKVSPATAISLIALVGLLTLFVCTPTAAALKITPLFHIPRQTHPTMPRYKPPTFVCTTGSLGDQLCCTWRLLYGPKYGFGVWDCTVVPKATGAIKYSERKAATAAT